jgi:hypothetical protein
MITIESARNSPVENLLPRICNAARALKIGRIEHRLYRDGVSYLTNDRLFVRSGPDGVEAVGIPKLPRVNPSGKIVHNSRRRIGVSQATCRSTRFSGVSIPT